MPPRGILFRSTDCVKLAGKDRASSNRFIFSSYQQGSAIVDTPRLMAQFEDKVAFGKSAAQSGGASVGNAPPAAGSGGLAENVAGMLAYVTFIPAIIFLLLEPYSRNRFIRFHSFQCIFLSVALFVIHIVLMFIP